MSRTQPVAAAVPVPTPLPEPRLRGWAWVIAEILEKLAQPIQQPAK